MTDYPTFSSDMSVKLIRHMGGDDSVIQSAQVSAKGENKPETVSARLINTLMREKHGSPFEHNAFTFFVKVPIFVVREWQRHRISSFNEMSGRYTELLPEFYIPSVDRPLINRGTSMKPEFFAGTISEMSEVRRLIREESTSAWIAYQKMLKAGIAREVARTVLPLNIYTQMYWTVNARSLMNFLSLRADQTDNMFPGHPQLEIQQAADKVETIFATCMPLTWSAWNENGRVAP